MVGVKSAECISDVEVTPSSLIHIEQDQADVNNRCYKLNKSSINNHTLQSMSELLVLNENGNANEIDKEVVKDVKHFIKKEGILSDISENTLYGLKCEEKKSSVNNLCLRICKDEEALVNAIKNENTEILNECEDKLNSYCESLPQSCEIKSESSKHNKIVLKNDESTQAIIEHEFTSARTVEMEKNSEDNRPKPEVRPKRKLQRKEMFGVPVCFNDGDDDKWFHTELDSHILITKAKSGTKPAKLQDSKLDMKTSVILNRLNFPNDIHQMMTSGSISAKYAEQITKYNKNTDRIFKNILNNNVERKTVNHTSVNGCCQGMCKDKLRTNVDSDRGTKVERWVMSKKDPLKYHFSRVYVDEQQHKKSTMLKCSYCLNQFNNVKSLLDHIKTHLLGSKNNDSNDKKPNGSSKADTSVNRTDSAFAKRPKLNNT